MCNTLLPCFGNFFEEKISKTHQFTVKICLILQEKSLKLGRLYFSVKYGLNFCCHFHVLFILMAYWSIDLYCIENIRQDSFNDLFIVLQLVNYPFLLIKETHARLAATTIYVLAYYVVNLIRTYHFFLTKTD